jgi:hypothetical protein
MTWRAKNRGKAELAHLLLPPLARFTGLRSALSPFRVDLGSRHNVWRAGGDIRHPTQARDKMTGRIGRTGRTGLTGLTRDLSDPVRRRVLRGVEGLLTWLEVRNREGTNDHGSTLSESDVSRSDPQRGSGSGHQVSGDCGLFIRRRQMSTRHAGGISGGVVEVRVFGKSAGRYCLERNGRKRWGNNHRAGPKCGKTCQITATPVGTR